MSDYRRYLVTAALPYANGPLHIGHLAGAYLPADIYVRYLKLMGKETLFICGSDEHGVPVLVRANQEGRSPAEIVNYYHELLRQTFKRVAIEFDEYFRTSDRLHHEMAQRFFVKLLEKGYLFKREVEQFYDPVARMFLADRYVVGTCPKCGYDGAYGDQCEKCGTALSPDELINPRSALTGVTPQKRRTFHWFFNLPVFESWLRRWILDENADRWKPNVLGQCRTWLNMGLKPRAVTRDLSWGVPVPLEEAQGKVLYVWFEAPIGYISATVHYCQRKGEDWERWWKDPETALVHFIGKDNIVFHCIFFPAMLKAHGEFILPYNVPANEFLNLEGDKISTSRNWAVWVHEFADRYPDYIDALRFVIARNMPETKDSEFTWSDFQQKTNNELVATLGNYIHRVWTLLYRATSGRVPELALDRLSSVRKWRVDLEKVKQLILNFRFKEALQEILKLAQEGNQLLAQEEPWRSLTSPETIEQLRLHMERVSLIAHLAYPYMPVSMGRLAALLGGGKLLEWKILEKVGEDSLVKVAELPQSRPMFKLVPDEMVKQEKARLLKMSKEDQEELIGLEDFSKVKMVTGTITEVKDHPAADRLYVVKVDVGSRWGGERTLVAGIKESYKPEELIGKQVIVLVNLQPKKIRGVESQGMLLAVESEDGKPVLIVPEKRVSDGSSVR